jgi:hypothetical protein
MVNKKLLRVLQIGLDQLAISNIKEAMKLDQFLNLAGEQVTNNPEARDSMSQVRAAESYDNDRGYKVLSKIFANEALDALYKLRLFLKQQADGNQPLLSFYVTSDCW